jgi:hypothetical protein
MACFDDGRIDVQRLVAVDARINGLVWCSRCEEIDGLAVDGKMGRIDGTAGRRLWLGGGLQSYDGLVEAVDG